MQFLPRGHVLWVLRSLMESYHNNNPYNLSCSAEVVGYEADGVPLKKVCGSASATLSSSLDNVHVRESRHTLTLTPEQLVELVQNYYDNDDDPRYELPLLVTSFSVFVLLSTTTMFRVSSKNMQSYKVDFYSTLPVPMPQVCSIMSQHPMKISNKDYCMMK